MANTPDDPNAPKPHDKGQTPPKKPEPARPADSDDIFDEVPAADVESSGISVHEWAALIEEESAPEIVSEELQIDSPSDKNLREEWPVTQANIDLPPEPVVQLPQTVPATEEELIDFDTV